MEDAAFARRYTLAIVWTTVALVLASVGRATWSHSSTYSLLLAAVMISSWRGGLGPGFVSTVLGTVTADYFLLNPNHTISFDVPRLLQIASFVFTAAVISFLNESRRAASAALAFERQQLERRVTERTAELSRAERNVRGLIESAPDAMVVIDRDARIIKVNSEAERMFGFGRAELIGTDVERLVPHRLRPAHRHRRSVYLENPGGRTADAEFFGRRADGTEFPVEVRVSSIESDDGPRALAVVRDVSARYAADQTQRRLVRALGKRIKELTALQATARLLNESPAQSDLLARVVGLLPPAWQYPEVTAARIVADGREVTTEGFRITPWLLRTTFATPGSGVGTIEVVYLEERPPEAEGPFLAEERSLIESIGQLLTAYFERIQAEQDRLRLARAEAARLEAQQANDAKDEFLATLSHELRAPLNVLLGWTRMLRGGHLDADACAHGLDVMERNVRLQAKLIEDLLDVSRIVTGKLRLERQRVDLSALAEEVADATRPAAEARAIRFTSCIEPSLWIDADAGRLHQIISNVLTNAVKFTPDGGAVQLTAVRAGSNVRIEVTDSGVGIDPALLPHVFDRFYQADGSTTRAHAGLGLGLAIVKRLMELHGGDIAAESEGVGRGSTFTMTFPLPRYDVLPAPAGAMPREDALLSGITVLVVDDDADTRETLTAILEHFGARAMAAGSADEGYAAFAAERPDILLSDLAMPYQDGYDLIRRIRTELHADTVPAAALSAYADAEHRSRSLAAGFQEHLAKPVDPTTLAMALARLVERT